MENSITDFDVKILRNVHITGGPPQSEVGMESFKKLQSLGFIRSPLSRQPSRLTDKGYAELGVYLKSKTI